MIPLLTVFGIFLAFIIFMALRRAQWRQDQVFRDRRARMAEPRRRSANDSSQVHPEFVFEEEGPKD